MPVDLDRKDAVAVLTSRGYTTTARTFLIWEEVTQSLTEDGAASTRRFLSKATRGSRLAFTYVRRVFLTASECTVKEAIYRRFVLGAIWQFGMEPDAVEA